VTKEFYTYREAVRLIWNTFLRDCAEPELDLPDIDRALFSAIVEARIGAGLKEQKVRKACYFPELEVKSPEAEVLKLTRQPELNVWAGVRRAPSAQLRYIGLFDFDWVSGVNRDFEYLLCVAVHGEGSEARPIRGDNLILVKARTARVKFIRPS
jgi:hypothetical protein